MSRHINWLAAGLIALAVGACAGLDGPSAQSEAEAVAMDAETAVMQATIDARCADISGTEKLLACAVDALAELQPDRWLPEEIAAGHEAARIAGGVQ